MFFHLALGTPLTSRLSPDFRTGNIINIVFASVATLLWVYQRFYYKYRNARNARLFAAMSDSEQEKEIREAAQKGNRSLTFVFTT